MTTAEDMRRVGAVSRPRVQPCLVCGKPVQSGKRGRAKTVHYGCRALWRKLKGQP